MNMGPQEVRDASMVQPVINMGTVTLPDEPHERLNFLLGAVEIPAHYPVHGLKAVSIQLSNRSQPVTCVVIVARDRYGRPVSTCSVGKMDLAYAMAKRGWAWAFTRYTDKYVGQEKTTAAQHLGLHGHICAAAWEWRATTRKTGY
jgi:hypothetical protein